MADGTENHNDVRISFNDGDDANETKPQKNGLSYFKLIEILISLAVPVTITIYTILQDKRQLEISREQRRQDADLANKTRWNDLQMADERLKDSLLNGYHDFLSDLLERNGMDLDKDPSARLVARFKTLTVLKQLDTKRKGQIIRSLHEAQLITIDRVNRTKPVLDLSFGILHGLDLTSDHRSFQNDFFDAYLSKTDLSNASFRNLNITGTKFNEALMNGADFTRTTASTSDCRNHYTSFQGAQLNNAYFVEVTYHFVDFDSATLNRSQSRSLYCAGCTFVYTDLFETDLSYSQFDVQTCRDSNTNEIQIEYSYFERNTFVDTNLYSSTFTEAEFSYSEMTRINASRINLNTCYLDNLMCVNCSFDNAIIKYSNFYACNLTGSTMINTQINGTDFSFSDMHNMDFTNGIFYVCSFYGVSFVNSIFTNTSFIECDFEQSSITDKQLEQTLQLVNVTLPNKSFIE